MYEMFPDLKKLSSILKRQHGFGLISAIFVIVILAVFGLLVARFVATSSISSSEDYRWTQALYAAESAARLRILYNDNGGSGVFSQPRINDFIISETNSYNGPGVPSTLSIEATLPGPAISREMQVKYIL